MTQTLDIVKFLELADTIPVVDVRTPLEFEHASIPGAFNLPIFSNEERVIVGTTYKQKGREEAILLGFDLTGPKWSGFIQQALKIAPGKKILVHCWRGGMRSGAMAWALNLYGFEVYLLEGGYKRYRNWVLAQFKENYPILILGGMTGSGKTKTLVKLKELNQQVIDLEDLAQHQGSSYGSMGYLKQPSQEHFENLLASQLIKIDKTKPLWLEDESLSIGKCFIPNPIFQQMRESALLKLEVPFQERVDFLVEEYGKLDKEFLIESTVRIGKRLGPEQTRDAIAAIREDRMDTFIKIVLVYYDKTYANGQGKREKENIHIIECSSTEADENSSLLLNYIQSNEILKPNTILNI
ncbi:tRNA 2-selenouridine synthase [Daejeonella rubra]|uniref:tRNA 2-selenouridine synthase n=1 Tax=Daejeonella rubra TaxID=990371 RepID=A0A1G9SYN2_9SPHI|nr:tRNA 2-selenouridine(34) synthase MnmH [Daejeonella rubra]SDM40561.1 tRNA 2-selenouridine synthase [Daejeonella rubra]